VIPKCHECGYQFSEGEEAWADDWNVIGVDGTSVTYRTETRYLCDTCEAKR
jgi:transposase-like protein